MGDDHTDEVDAKICFNCPAGMIYREVRCSSVTPRLRVIQMDGGSFLHVEGLFCPIRKRDTTAEYCRTCNLVTAETTRQLVTETRGIFTAQGFYSAYQDLEAARSAMRDGHYDQVITRSISCLESVMRICHERLAEALPSQKQVTNLWKSTRALLRFDEMEPSGSAVGVLNSLSGVVSNLGQMRNALGDAHGRGESRAAVSPGMAELALNTALTLATAIARRLQESEGGDRSDG
jgi:hypothetical protein